MAKRKKRKVEKTFAEEFRELMVESGKTPHWIAKAIGSNYSTVYMFYHGKRDSITLVTASKIAKVLNLHVIRTPEEN